MKEVFSYVKPYKWTAIFALCLMLLELFVELVQPLIMAKIIDEGVRAQNQGMVLQWGLFYLRYLLLPFWRALSILIFLPIQLKAFRMIFEMPCLIGFNPLR